MELIHTCYRVTDPEGSIAFYEALGLEKRREMPIRDEAVNYFLGVPGQELPELELTLATRRVSRHHHRDGRQPDDTARTVLHELIHAAQSERYDSYTEWRKAYDRENQLRGYDGNRFEVEAREVAKEFSSDFRLAR